MNTNLLEKWKKNALEWHEKQKTEQPVEKPVKKEAIPDDNAVEVEKTFLKESYSHNSILVGWRVYCFIRWDFEVL